MSSTNATAGQSQTQSKPQLTFDFTKRKRWADLLLTELVDNIVFVLSTQGRILFCGHAITELLGWKEVDLLDINFYELVDIIDQARFKVTFNEALETGMEFNILLRLASRMSTNAQPKFVLFDMKCYPHLVTTGGEMETKCFFAMATPYPSRNTAILDTILDLKAENHRLRHLVAEERARLPPDFEISKKQTQAVSTYAPPSSSSSLHMPKPGPGFFHAEVSQGRGGGGGPPLGAYLPMSGAHRPDGVGGGSSNGVQFTNVIYESGSAHTDNVGEEGSKKKKAKRTQFSEQYICVRCGRTDSPEWRKGPAGPKTLCNACGLRWAKQVRKVDEHTAGREGMTAVAMD